MKMRKTQRIFLISEEFVNIKSSFFDSLKGPYIEFNYNIENNDSIGRILKKLQSL